MRKGVSGHASRQYDQPGTEFARLPNSVPGASSEEIMNAMTIAALSSITTGGTAYFLAWLVHGRQPPPSADDITEFMDRVVAAEEVEARERRLRRMLHDADRHSLPRTDAGPPARVTTMRIRR